MVHVWNNGQCLCSSARQPSGNNIQDCDVRSGGYVTRVKQRGSTSLQREIFFNAYVKTAAPHRVAITITNKNKSEPNTVVTTNAHDFSEHN